MQATFIVSTDSAETAERYEREVTVTARTDAGALAKASQNVPDGHVLVSAVPIALTPYAALLSGDDAEED